MANAWGGALVPTGVSQSSGEGLNLGLQQAQNQAQQESQSQSTNNAFNNAYGTSFIPDYSQTPILERIAQEAENYAPQVYNWGIDAYNRNQGSIDDLMRQGQMWASPQHIAAMMGQAEAGVQQAGEQARQSAIQDLQGYGIDPSAGRYAALDQANRVQTAAAAAGAGNQQRMADISQGLTMQNQAMSAGLQNTQIGYGAANSLNSLLGTGMQLKYSPLGQTSTATGGSTGQSSSSGQGTSSGSSLGQTFGENQQQSASQQNQPVNVMSNVGVMVRRGGYIDQDRIEHPDGGVSKYQTGGSVAARLATPMAMPASSWRPPVGQNTAALRMASPGFDTRGMLQRAQADIANLPPGVRGMAERTFQGAERAAPDLLQHYGLSAYQEGGEVDADNDDDDYAAGGVIKGRRRRAGGMRGRLSPRGNRPPHRRSGGGSKGGQQRPRPDDGAQSDQPSETAGTTPTSADATPDRVRSSIPRPTDDVAEPPTTGPDDVFSTPDAGATPEPSVSADDDRYQMGSPVQGYRRGGHIRSFLTPATPGGPNLGADLAAQTDLMQQHMALQGVRPETIGDAGPGFDPGAGRIDPMTGQQNMPATYSDYAGGGVVGTTSPGFMPSGPIGGAPISAGMPSFTSGMSRGMAGGGSVAPTTGGFVSRDLSPSGGNEVDDVPARLNEGEYVIPRDVVGFKGKEFFHKLIAQSRKAREMYMGGPVNE